MTWELRPYQKKFIKSLAQTMLIDTRVIACAPTGSGKSKMMASIALNAIKPKPKQLPKSVLVITESRNIYGQLRKELPIIDINAGIQEVHVQRGTVYLAMAQTLSRRPQMIQEFKELGYDLIIMNDEAHIGTASKLLMNFVDTNYILGFTATPDWKAAKHLPKIYNECVQACQVDDLIQEGFLCSYRHIARDSADLDILEMRGADFSEESQEAAFSTSEVYDGLLEDLHQYKFKKAMVFCASIKSCEETYMQLLENGFAVCRYHSGNKDFPLDNPDFELAKFIDPKINLCNICVSVASLTKGFDFPPVDMICLLRKTNSLPLYLQMMGRGSRPVTWEQAVREGWDKFMTQAKTEFTVLDYGSHYKDPNLGLYWDDRDWLEKWQEPKSRKKKKEGEGVASLKICENCDELISANARICALCGYVYPLIEKQLAVGEMVEVTRHYTDLIGRNVGSLSPMELSVYAKMKSKRNHAIRIAMCQENNGASGFIRDFGRKMGFNSEWVTHTENEARVRAVKSFSDLILK